MKKLSNPLLVRKSRSTSDQEFSKTKQPFRKYSITLATEDKLPIYWDPKFSKNKSESLLTLKKTISETSSSESKNFDFPLIPTPKTPKNPKDILKKSLLQLKSCQWKDSIEALQNIVQISRFNPQLLEKSTADIWKGTTALLKSLRSVAARTACQAANELFMNIKSFKGPEFEELIYALLKKTSATKKSLRKDVLEALDSMVIFVPPDYCVKILLHRKIAGFGLNARRISTKLLACVFSTTGAELATALTDDWKIRLIQAGTRFLQDDCNEIKFHGMHLMTMLMQQQGFQNTFQSKVNLSNLYKTLESVKNSFR